MGRDYEKEFLQRNLWKYQGSYPTKKEAEQAAKRARARGWQVKIVGKRVFFK
jgi:hypothetical protein